MPYGLSVTDVGSNSATIHWKTTEMTTTIENFRVNSENKFKKPPTINDKLFLFISLPLFRFFAMELATMYRWMANTCWILMKNFNMLPLEKNTPVLETCRKTSTILAPFRKASLLKNRFFTVNAVTLVTFQLTMEVFLYSSHLVVTLIIYYYFFQILNNLRHLKFRSHKGDLQ